MREQIKSKRFIGEFGVAVRKRRHKLELSQEGLAHKAHIHRTYISSIELGKVDMGMGVAYKVAKALNLPLSRLVKETESEI